VLRRGEVGVGDQRGRELGTITVRDDAPRELGHGQDVACTGAREQDDMRGRFVRRWWCWRACSLPSHEGWKQRLSISEIESESLPFGRGLAVAYNILGVVLTRLVSSTFFFFFFFFFFSFFLGLASVFHYCACSTANCLLTVDTYSGTGKPVTTEYVAGSISFSRRKRYVAQLLLVGNHPN